MKGLGFNLKTDFIEIKIANAKEHLLQGLNLFTSNKAVWLPEYDEIVSWLSDNHGRGLLCYGNCGRGKTIICWKIIPILVYVCYGKIVSCFDAQQMNADLDLIKNKALICIDDFGTENLSVKYGEKRMAFSEIVDEAERKGKLLILTTNLSLDEISQKYGERTMDRLVGITKRVLFKGGSLRK